MSSQKVIHSAQVGVRSVTAVSSPGLAGGGVPAEFGDDLGAGRRGQVLAFAMPVDVAEVNRSAPAAGRVLVDRSLAVASPTHDPLLRLASHVLHADRPTGRGDQCFDIGAVGGHYHIAAAGGALHRGRIDDVTGAGLTEQHTDGLGLLL